MPYENILFSTLKTNLPKIAILILETNSVDKSLVLYSNFGHLLMLEKGGQKINDDVAEWIGECAE